MTVNGRWASLLFLGPLSHILTFARLSIKELVGGRIPIVRQAAKAMSRVERLCVEKGLKMTGQRRVIARVLSNAKDHPDANEVYRRAILIDPHISLATVYRTVRVFEQNEVLERHDFGDGRARYEESGSQHHDHLINIETGRVIEFHNDQIEALQRLAAEELGFHLVGHRLELYGITLETSED